MARRLSSFRSGVQTFALTTSEVAFNQLSLIWGVVPFFDRRLDLSEGTFGLGESTMVDLMNVESDSTSEMLKIGEETLRKAGAVNEGETIVILAGRLSGLGLSSSVIVWTIGETITRR